MSIIKHIDVITYWQSRNAYDSHRPALYLAWENTNGVVMEFGCGDGSTPLLERYCHIQQMPFYSFDTDKEWTSKYETTLFVEDLMSLPAMFVDLLFVDSKPGEKRKELIEKWKDHAKVIIAHDTEPGAEYVYGMAEILSTFKYRLDYAPEEKPWTTIVSNHIDPNQWINQPELTSFTIPDDLKNMNR